MSATRFLGVVYLNLQCTTGYLSPETYQTILSLITYVLREFLLLRHMLLRNVLTLRFIVIDEPLLKRLGFARQFSILFIIPF